MSSDRGGHGPTLRLLRRRGPLTLAMLCAAAALAVPGAAATPSPASIAPVPSAPNLRPGSQQTQLPPSPTQIRPSTQPSAAARGAGFRPGPRGGDQFNLVQVDPSSGRVTVVRVYPFPGVFNCGGGGGFATLEVVARPPVPVTTVTVSYANSAWDSYTWLTALVRDGARNWLGGKQVRGPAAGRGTLAVPLATTAAAGSTLIVDFGLQVASACPNADGGSITFTAVSVGGAGSPPPPPPPPGPPGPPPGLSVPFALVSTANFEYVPGDTDLRAIPLQVAEAMGLLYLNGDAAAPHTVTSDALGPNGKPLFDSGAPISAGQFTPVAGVASLPAGTYTFHCSVHTQMHGTLHVVVPPAAATGRQP